MRRLTHQDPESRPPDLAEQRISLLKEAMPEVFADGKVDFAALKQLLGETIDDSDERYGLSWHGKSNARRVAMVPSMGTLRPDYKTSVNWDTTQNLVIEGDNLEVLKLLQKSYSSAVKMIYIDPPYNTGTDFIYPDNFRDSLSNYLQLTSQIDNSKMKISSNTETSGRFHTAWLNMMYPRLHVARSLLRLDGLVCISIDSQEVANLRLMCDEIFGPENFVEQIVWKNKYGSGAQTRGCATVHEYILIYSKTPISNIAAPLTADKRRDYKYRDSQYPKRGGYITQPLATTSKDDRPNLRYPIHHKGIAIWPEKQWIWSESRFLAAYNNDEIVINEKNGKYSVRMKQYLRDENGIERLSKPVSILNGPFNQEGTKELRTLFGKSVFDFPKPSELVRYLFSFIVNDKLEDGGIYLDFFAGSFTAAHAVMSLNAADGGKRRFIMIQLPEQCSPESQAATAGYNNIADLGKQRIRNIGKKLMQQREAETGELLRQESVSATELDVGFRVFKLDSSNIQAWDPSPTNLEAQLIESIDHIKPDRNSDDILYELLLRLGFDLTEQIQVRVISGKPVSAVGSGTLIVCLAESIRFGEVETLSHGILKWWKELAPTGDSMIVFLDNSFEDDVSKANLAAILQQHGLSNVRSI